LSLAKALLGSCVRGKSGEEVYASYFAPYTLIDSDANLSCLKSRPNQERKIRKSMYNSREPSQNPGYFTLESHTDVNRLCKVIDHEIVIYFADDRRFQFFEIYHDFRGFSQSSGREKKTLYYVLTVERKLYKFSQSLDNLFEGSPYFFGLERSRIYSQREDYGTLLARLLKVSAPNFPIKSLLDLAFCTKELYDLWGKRVALVNFCKSNFNQKDLRNSSRRMQPRFSYFFNLGFVGPRLDDPSVKSLDLDSYDTVVCFYAENFGCILKEPYRRAVLDQYRATTRKDTLSSNNFDKIPHVTTDEQRIALAKNEAKKRNKKKRKLFESAKKAKICSCEKCSSDNFDLNMEESGPEKLCSYFLDLSDLLKLMGLDTPDNVASVDRMCELSVASMDIESMTVDVDLTPPVAEIGGLRYATIDSASLEGHCKKVQKPLMIAHLDGLGPVTDEPKIFQIESDSEESVYKMLRDYWRHVKEQHVLAVREKKKLAQPLLEIIQDYKNKHFEVYAAWCQENNQPSESRSISQAWTASLPGQLEKRLLRLMTDYTVFSFYG